MLLAGLGLHIVLQPLDDLLLRRDLILSPLQLLLQYLLTLLSFSQLFPQYSVRAELLLQIVNLVVVFLLLDGLFEFLEQT